MIDDNNNKVGDTIPLYDLVKRTIYINFTELVNAYSVLMTSSKFEQKMALWDFKKRYSTFFLQVNHPTKLNKLNYIEVVKISGKDTQIENMSKQNYLKRMFQNLDKINVKKAELIILYSRELIEELGITKIEGRVKDPSKAILGEY